MKKNEKKPKIWKIEKITQLKKVGKEISALLSTNTLLFLSGELGSGKTTLTKLISQQLGIKENVQSPTFNLLKQYPINFNNKKIFLNHYDLFRLKKEKELNALLKELKELTIGNINIIEWGENDPYFSQWLKNPDYKVIHLEIKVEGGKRVIYAKQRF